LAKKGVKNGRNLEQTGARKKQATEETGKAGEKTGTETKQGTSGLDEYAGIYR
jgi:hypothetical protein